MTNPADILIDYLKDLGITDKEILDRLYKAREYCNELVEED